jgi:hypothetical protein
MSFNISLGINSSEDNRINKSVSYSKTLTGNLKDQTSIIDPVILIECSLDDIVNCNYCNIPQFNRKYFIKDITSVRNGLCQITCHVDVLDSFADEILSNSAIIKRQENEWNLYVNDGAFFTYQNPNIITKSFPSGFSSQSFVLAIAGS